MAQTNRKPRTAGRAGKQRGDAYERELASHINKHLFGGQQVCQRAPLSGGGHITPLAGGSDLIGLPEIFVEAKRYQKPSPYRFIEQAEDNLTKRQSPDAPVTMTRKDRLPTGQSLVTMRLDDWLKLYEAYLRQTGAYPPQSDEDQDAPQIQA